MRPTRAFICVQAVVALLLAGWLMMRRPEVAERESTPDAVAPRDEPVPSGGLFGAMRPAGDEADDPSAGSGLEPAPPAVPARSSEIEVVPAALDWLVRHQAADGGWGNGWSDGGRTGLAVLAFLGSGVTHRDERRGSSVKRALDYLEKDMDFRLREIDSSFPGCERESYRVEALAGLALVEAYGVTGTRKLRAPAEAAVRLALRSRSSGGGWNFFVSGKADVETTAFMVMLLKSAQNAEVGTYREEIGEALAAVDLRTDQATGRIKPGRRREPHLSEEAATAMGMTVRLCAGRTPSDDTVLSRAAAFLAEKPPSASSPDPLHWYFGTVIAHWLGSDAWAPWNRALQTAVLDRQRTEAASDDRGSWDPSGNEFERHETTALFAMITNFRWLYLRAWPPR